MKDFNDFLKTLTEEEIVKMSSKINALNLSTQVPLTQEGLGDFLSKSTTSNLIFSLELLERYHNWLHAKN